MRKKIIGILICILLIFSSTTLALTPFSKNEQRGKNQFFNITPVPLPTSGGWMKTFGGIYDEASYSIQQTTDGGYIIAGQTFQTSGNIADLMSIKTDSQGKSKTTSFDNLGFEWLFQRFPNAFPLLRQLMGY